MSQPTWITPAGSLGVIPEGIFYQQNMLASTPVEASVVCTSTTAGTNIITCESTAGLWENLNVMFTGTVFGGVSPNIRYFVNQIISDTEFTIATTEFTNITVPLTTATGIMTAEFTQHVYFKLISGELPPGIQCSDNGLIIGVPKAVASLQGVPFQVNRDVTSRFTVRGYTLRPEGGVLAIDGIRDRTFSLTVSGDNIPQWITPAGSIGQYYDGDLIDFQLEYINGDPGDVVTARVVSGMLPGGVTLTTDGLIYGYIAPAQSVTDPPGYDLTPQDAYGYDFIVNSTDKNYQFTVELSDGKNSNLRTFNFFVYARNTLTADDTQLDSDNGFVTADETTTLAPFLENAFPRDLGTVRSDNYFAYKFIGKDYDSTNNIEYVISVNEGEGLPPGLTLDPTSGWYYGYIPDQGVTQVTYSFNIQVRQIDNPTITSQLYPFTLTIIGAIDAEVVWITPADDTAYTKKINGVDTVVYSLGGIDNGGISIFNVEAVNRGGRLLSYKLKSGAFNELPQGLTLQPNGDIAGRVSFDTFSLDQGYTTFDKEQNTVLNTSLGETTFDLTFVFTVNAYAEDLQQVIYKVESIEVLNGGVGYLVPPTIILSSPVGAEAVTATVGTVTVAGGKITSVTVNNAGDGYTGPATYSIIGAGSGAVLKVNMIPSGTKDVVSVYRTCSIRVNRVYNKPYQNLYIEAMPPADDRQAVLELLQNQEIFQPDFIYRPNDPNFGKSKKVTYQHAYGLNPDVLDVYVEALYKNHYFKNLTLGEIKTAQALDASGNVIYEVVYSLIVDNLVNENGQSVNKIVNLPYPILDPTDSSILTQVYPNSLVNMRDQMVDVVGQISTKLPLWMTSKQPNGRVLGFTPAWVICYTKPNRSNQIAYYISTKFGKPLNTIDFTVDRYILDASLSKNWDPTKIVPFGESYLVGGWTPDANLTTFDRYYTPDQVNIGTVDIATNLAFTDINNRPLSYINSIGGLDGPLSNINNNTIIFATQEGFANYETLDAAWQLYQIPFDTDPFDSTSFDEAVTVPGGYTVECTATTSGTNVITCQSTVAMNVGDLIWFTGDDLSGLVALVGTSVYKIYSIESLTEFKLEDPNNPGHVLSLSTDSGSMTAQFGDYRMAIWKITVTDGIVYLSLYQQTAANQFITIKRGSYTNSQLYYGTAPPPGLTRVTWVNVPEGSSTETIFDQGSLQFVEPVDMYDPTTTYDKYLVYPKANILE